MEVHCERRVGKRVRQRRQLFRQDDRALSRKIGNGEAARLLEHDVVQSAVPPNRKFDDRQAIDVLIRVPARLDTADHRRQVVGAAEIGDVESRGDTGPPPVDSPKTLPARLVTATALPARVSSLASAYASRASWAPV
jgi:hypothetical protein